MRIAQFITCQIIVAAVMGVAWLIGIEPSGRLLMIVGLTGLLSEIQAMAFDAARRYR